MVDAEDNFKVVGVENSRQGELYYISTKLYVTDYDEDEYLDMYTGKATMDIIQNSIDDNNKPFTSKADSESNISCEYNSKSEISSEISLPEE